MSYIQGANRAQITFMPSSIEEYISEDNPIRVIDVFVDSLDLDTLGFNRATPSEMGRPAYAPADLLKLFVYGYMNKVRSSRKLMTECYRNVELFYLLGKLTPDFRTIADFRKDNAKPIREVFSCFVRLCNKLSLYEKKLVAVDGTKVRAVNADDKAYNKDILLKKLERIDKHIDDYLKELDKNDAEDDAEDGGDLREYTPEEIKKIVDDLKKRKIKYEDFLSELKETGKTQILTTDPEAHRMHTRNGFHCCYNIQAATDSGSHLIADYSVSGLNNDQGQLCATSEGAKKLLDEEVLEVVADKGYESRKDILNCIMNGIIPNVAFKYDKDVRLFNINYKPCEITDGIKNSTKPEDIKKCISAGILPTCYEGSAISVEIQEPGGIGYFTRLDNENVLCPMKNKLHKIARRGGKTIYRNLDACRMCKNRCTSSEAPKEVCFSDGTTCIAARMYGKTDIELNGKPEGAELSPNNHILDRKVKPKKVVLHLRCDKEKIHTRMCTVEHPFGTVKWYGDANYVLCKGIEKVTAEIGLSFLAYNMKRAINMAGTKAIIEGIYA